MAITAGLLETYKTCSNEEFKHHVRHIESLASDADENLDCADLMTKVETKYDALIKAKAWGKKDVRDEQILALQAKISDLEKKRKRGNGRNNTRETDKPPPNDKRRYAEWQYVKPKDGKTHIKKKVNGKQVDYWWCEPLDRCGQGISQRIAKPKTKRTKATVRRTRTRTRRTMHNFRLNRRLLTLWRMRMTNLSPMNE